MNTELKVQKWGNSLGIRIPIAIAKVPSICENDILEVVVKKSGLVLKKSNKNKPPVFSEKDLLSSMPADNNYIDLAPKTLFNNEHE